MAIFDLCSEPTTESASNLPTDQRGNSPELHSAGILISREPTVQEHDTSGGLFGHPVDLAFQPRLKQPTVTETGVISVLAYP
jgi:hypothetical protein